MILLSLVMAARAGDSGVYLDTGVRAEAVDVTERGCGANAAALVPLLFIGLLRPRSARSADVAPRR
jgi:hypothetical protein